MIEKLRLFILAGEPPGDRIAADLVARLRGKVNLELSGVGGDELAGQGLTSLYPMSDLAVMGITDVLLNLPRLLWRLEETARAILMANPNMVVLVDAQDFSRLLAARLRKRGYTGRLVLYVAPSVWARHPERAKRLAPLFDAVLAVLPFEPEAMSRLGGPPTNYVGHPALAEAIASQTPPDRGPLVLLPRLRDRLVAETANWPAPVRVVETRAARREIYQQAIGAICVSGTVTLELALARVPMVVIYALDSHQSRAYAKLGRPQVSLPNIILGRPIVREFVAAPLLDEPAKSAMIDLLDNKKVRQDQVQAFDELCRIMETGLPPHLREDPADRILAVWRNQRSLIGE